MLQQKLSRKINLFRLLAGEKDYKPTSHFSEKLQVSKKTIYNDISTLNEDLKQYNLKIEKAPRKGLRLKGAYKDIEKCYQNLIYDRNEQVDPYSPKQRQMELVKLIFIQDETVSTLQFAKKMYISATSLRNDVDQIQAIFSKYDVKIGVKENELYMDGKENNMQRACIYYYISSFEENADIPQSSFLNFKNFIAGFFESNDIDVVSACIFNQLNLKNENIADYYMKSLLITLLLLIIRSRLGFHINSEKKIFENMEYMEPYMLAINITVKISDSLNIDFYDEDCKYLSGQLFAHGIKLPKTVVYRTSPMYLSVEQMILKMSKAINVDLDQDTILKESLTAHLPPMIYRLQKGIKIKNPLLSDIKKQYIVMFSLVWFVASELESQYKIVLDDDEVSFLMIHFQLSLDKKYQQKNIVIVCPMGLSTSQFIFNRVKQFVSANDNIIALNMNELYFYNLENVDFIISSIPITGIEKPIINVSPLINAKDEQNIRSFCTDLNVQMTTLRTVAYREGRELMKFIKPSFLFIKENLQNKEECLKFIVETYQTEKIVTDDFQKSLIDREELGDTSLYTGVAMPHAFPDTVLKSQISIITLPKKIKWGMNQITMIIVVCIAEADIGQIKKVIANLITFIETKERVEDINNMSSSKELYEYLEREL
ncbi:MAG: BglG family transcription antiterminator [Breznakia sp.]